MEENEKSIKTYFATIIIIQFVCVAIFLLGVFAVKKISPKTGKKISKFYENKMCEKTDVAEIEQYFKDEI